MMKKFLLAALVAGASLTAVAPASAREGCGPGFHRGVYGHCRPNRGGPGGPMIVERGPVVGSYHHGRGYWDGRRYWDHRERHHGGWRYR